MAETKLHHIETIASALCPIFTGDARHRFKHLRMAILLDQSQLAKALGVQVASVTNIENGARIAKNPITLERMIAVFGIRGVVHILTGQYASEFEGGNVWSKYWAHKQSSMGNRTKYKDREETRYRDVSKLDLIHEVEHLRKIVKQVEFKKSEKTGKN